MKNAVKLDESAGGDKTVIEDFDLDSVLFDDKTIEELRQEFGDEITDKAQNITLKSDHDDLLKYMVELIMNTMDVQSLIEIALANPVAEDFNRNNPLNYVKRDFEKSWYHTRTAKTVSLDKMTESVGSETEIPSVVDVEEISVANISAEEFLNTLDETDKKLSICL